MTSVHPKIIVIPYAKLLRVKASTDDTQEEIEALSRFADHDDLESAYSHASSRSLITAIVVIWPGGWHIAAFAEGGQIFIRMD